MCGIYGLLGRERSSDDRVLNAMDSSLFHRGPDEYGQYRSSLARVGMRRLSIVDLATGSQPIPNESRDIFVVFNGEIYNFAELRADLRARGHYFSTQSDTEVIVHGYEQWGDDIVRRLSGMFAICVVDERLGRVLLARDHIGKKPLYYTERNGQIAFASELKALRQIEGFDTTIDRESMWHYFTLKNVPAPRTIYTGVRQLMQGQCAVYSRGDFTVSSYYKPTFTGESNLTEDEAASELLPLLRESVKRRLMVADVPVGAYLSGGLDSSLIVALAAEMMPGTLKTFSLGYASAVTHKQDVSYARRVADHYGTDHQELLISIDDVIVALPRIVEAFDEPFSAGSSPYYLAELISQHVKVALTGDGADELFGSYAAHRMAAVVQAMRGSEERSAAIYGSFQEKRSLADACASEPDNVWRTRFCAFTDEEKSSLFVDADFPTTASLLVPFYEEARGDLVNRTLEVECRTLLPDQILAYVDRLSMAHSLEVRSPFLDRSIVDYASILPGNLKVRPSASKSVLKTAARSILPDEIIDRPKEGFVLPFDAWLAGDLLPFLRDVTSSANMQHGYFVTKTIDRMIDDHVTGRRDHTYRLWTIVMFQLWYARFAKAGTFSEPNTCVATTRTS